MITSAVKSEDTAAEVPKVFDLFRNVPNPFNPSTAIRYVLYEPGVIDLRIYDQLGREVTVLAERYQSAGNHEIMWDGRDTNGNRISSGVYFYTLRAGGMEDTGKMILIK